jgi:hypothetical protein
MRIVTGSNIPAFGSDKAQEQVATGYTRGKIVLKVGDEPNTDAHGLNTD